MLGKQIVTVRGSSWTRLFDCAHSWEGTTILGLRSVSGLRAVMGSAIHASTALYDKSRMEGRGLTVIDTASEFIDKLHRPEGDYDFRGDNLSVREAERIGVTLHSLYCQQISDHYEFVAVEMATVPLEIDCGNGIVIRITGTLDRSRIKKGARGPSIADLKTGQKSISNGIVKTRGHRPQLGTYELLFENTTGTAIVEDAEIIGLGTGNKQEVGAAPVSGSKQLLIGTPEQPGLIAFAAAMFKTGLFPPNPTSWICNEKYCARWQICRYRDR